MKINIIRAILITLLIGTFGIIFGFSSQNSTQSAGISRKITNAIIINIKSIEEKDDASKEEILAKIEHIIRKIAHFSIYTLVGILLMSLCKTYNLKEFDRFSISLISGLIYASSDEIHQAFVPGRGPMLTDILIDTSGVTVGILLVMEIFELYKKITLKKDIKTNKN